MLKEPRVSCLNIGVCRYLTCHSLPIWALSSACSRRSRLSSRHYLSVPFGELKCTKISSMAQGTYEWMTELHLGWLVWSLSLFSCWRINHVLWSHFPELRSLPLLPVTFLPEEGLFQAVKWVCVEAPQEAKLNSHSSTTGERERLPHCSNSRWVNHNWG